MGQITIIGLGLIGGSAGLAWRRSLPDWEIVGHDREPEVSGQARKIGAIHRSDWNLLNSVEKADVVVLATPVSAMPEIMRLIANDLRPGVVVTDVGSTKRQVMAWAAELLPSNVQFVGGHPMAGKETAGIDAAEATLFEKRPYCITPSVDASPEAVETVVALAKALGADPYFLDADEHDGLVAAVSHLPLLISTALVSATASSPTWREMSRLAGTGYSSVSRLASGDPAMHTAICRTNKDNLLRWLDVYVEELGKLRQLIDTDDEALLATLTQIKEARDKWERGEEVKPISSTPIPSAGETIAKSFIGDKLFNFSRGKDKDKDKKDPN